MKLQEKVKPFVKSIILGFSARQCLNELDSFVGVADKDFNLLCANLPFRRAFGIKKLPDNLKNYLPPEKMAQVISTVGNLDSNNQTVDYQIGFNDHLIGFRGKAIFKKNRSLDHYIITGQDITEKKRIEEELKANALVDPQTGAYNLRFFKQEFNIGSHSRIINGLTMVILDIDHFKQINDRFGHDFGDEVLKKLTRVIKSTIRPEDIFARIGGDEFAIALPDLTDPNKVQLFLYRLNNILIDNDLYVSFGFTTAEKNSDYDSVFHQADQMLLKIKADKKIC